MTKTTEAVTHSVLVPLPPEAAFELFTDRFSDWWPKDSHHVSLAWHLTPDWRFDPDPAKATEVEVTFSADDDQTRVTLEHRGFEVHGERGAAMRESVSSEGGGWPSLMELYRRAA